MLGWTSRITSPPRPPLPPSGPPSGLNFSLVHGGASMTAVARPDTQEGPGRRQTLPRAPPYRVVRYRFLYKKKKKKGNQGRTESGPPRVASATTVSIAGRYLAAGMLAAGLLLPARSPRGAAARRRTSPAVATPQGEQRVVPASGHARPGWKWVPRWRTMISPALTCWPPNRFDAQALGRGVAAVPAGRCALFRARRQLFSPASLRCSGRLISLFSGSWRCCSSGPRGAPHAGDLHLGVLLPVSRCRRTRSVSGTG